jgi:hypothetical protein
MFNRFRNVHNKALPFVALIIFVALLSEVLFKPIGLLIIPIFVITNVYLFYYVFFGND